MLKIPDPTKSCIPRTSAWQRTELVLGNIPGGTLFAADRDLGYQLDDDQLDKIFEEFKRLCDKKKEIFDADIEALVEKRLHSGTRMVEIGDAPYRCRDGSYSLRHDHASAVGWSRVHER